MDYRTVSKKNPCLICGRIKRCRFNEKYLVCWYIEKEGGKKGIAKNGDAFHLYFRDQLIDSCTQIFDLAPRNYQINESSKSISIAIEPSSAKELDSIYRWILYENLKISDEHRSALIARGFPSDKIELYGYRTWPIKGRKKLAESLIQKFGVEICKRVPGFYYNEKGKYWSLMGPEGIIFPLRNGLVSQIRALKIRADHDDPENKYIYFSSIDKGGVSSGSHAHVSYSDNHIHDTTRITEGEIKSDIATLLTGILTISIPGVSCWAKVLDVLKMIRPKTVRLAFDADFVSNRMVANAMISIANAVIEMGMCLEIETWKFKKGIDDALAANIPIKVMSMDESIAYLKRIPSLFRAE